MGEVRQMIEARRLCSLGIGLIDAHLLASVLISPPTRLWTRDKPLRKAAERLGVAPADCLVFEDTDLGIQAATAAGMVSVKVPLPFERNASPTV